MNTKASFLLRVHHWMIKSGALLVPPQLRRYNVPSDKRATSFQSGGDEATPLTKMTHQGNLKTFFFFSQKDKG